MSTGTLNAWTNVVTLHPDVESGNLTEAVFAIDLGAIAANDKNVPVVYRDPEEFFKMIEEKPGMKYVDGQKLMMYLKTEPINND